MGLVQQTGGVINIGFDSSIDNSQYNFINVTGSWQQSADPGSIMIRPVVGGNYFIGVDEQLVEQDVRIYPNPASSSIHIDGVSNGTSIAVYDIMGRQVMQEAFRNELSVSHLSNGLYLLNITTAEGNVITKKIMVNQ